MTYIRKAASAAIALAMISTPIAAQAQSGAANIGSAWGGAMMSSLSSLCAGQSAGCILPVPNVTPKVATPKAPVAQAPVTAPETKSGGFPFLAVIAGLAAIAGGILLLDGDSDDDPISA